MLTEHLWGITTVHKVLRRVTSVARSNLVAEESHRLYDRKFLNKRGNRGSERRNASFPYPP